MRMSIVTVLLVAFLAENLEACLHAVNPLLSAVLRAQVGAVGVRLWNAASLRRRGMIGIDIARPVIDDIEQIVAVHAAAQVAVASMCRDAAGERKARKVETVPTLPRLYP